MTLPGGCEAGLAPTGAPQGSTLGWGGGAAFAGDPQGSIGWAGAGWALWWPPVLGGAGRGEPQGSVGAAAGACDTWAPQGSDGCDWGESRSSSPPACCGFCNNTTHIVNLCNLFMFRIWSSSIDVFPIIFDIWGLRPDMLCFPCFSVWMYVFILWRHSPSVNVIMQTKGNRSMSGLSPLNTSNIIGTRHVFVKQGCPRRQQSPNMAKNSKSYILTPPTPPPGAWDVSEVWGTNRWTYSPSLVTVSSPKL